MRREFSRSGCVNGTHDLSSAPVVFVRATPPDSVRQVFAEWYEMREFITLLCGARSRLVKHGSWSWWRGDLTRWRKLPTIGFLGAVTPSAGGEPLAAFVTRHPL